MAQGEALALFDLLGPVTLDAMPGRWRGSGFATGHPLDGWLEAFGWYGKEFGESPDDAQPLLFGRAGGKITAINPATVPIGIVKRLNLKRSRLARGAFRLGKGLVAARRPTARLRMMEYRGVASATIVYDALPILDHLRQVEPGVLLGAMDYRGFDQPFFFVLERE